MWRISESGRLIGVDEESLIRREERISRKMYRLYGLIKKQPDRSRRTIRELYQKSFEARAPTLGCYWLASASGLPPGKHESRGLERRHWG